MDDKVVVITGAARGIGRACVQAFLDEGAKVAALDLSWQPSGLSGDMDDSFYDYLRSRPDDVAMVTCDIANTSQVQAAYDETIEKFGTVDFLYNNAGMRMRNLYPPAGRGITTLQTTRSEWQQMFDVTVFGAIEVTKLFVQPMIEKRRGSILTTISSGVLHHSHGGAYMALRPNSREVPYQPAKAAIQCAMFYLADEVAEFNVAVNILVPGRTRTTGFDEQNASRTLLSSKDAGARPPRPGALRANDVVVSPDHVVPLVKFLSEQDARGGVTGRCFDTMSWNIEHGCGSWDRWVDSGAEQGIAEALKRIAAEEGDSSRS